VVKRKALLNLDIKFFNDRLFAFVPNQSDSEIERVKKLIDEKSNDEAWITYNKNNGNGIPRALIGEHNYQKFLNEFINNSSLMEEYKKFFRNTYSEFKNQGIRLSKPFIILAGISGTGKTRFVRDQAERSGSLKSSYQLVSVRPDWHEPSDVIGYISRLNGEPKYIVTDVLRFIVLKVFTCNLFNLII
jgi:hypothetical protein